MRLHVGHLPKWNPHPCGFYGDSKRECRCSTRQIENYRQRISGPLLDRIDIHCEVPLVDFRELSSHTTSGEKSEIISGVTLGFQCLTGVRHRVGGDGGWRVARPIDGFHAWAHRSEPLLGRERRAMGTGGACGELGKFEDCGHVSGWVGLGKEKDGEVAGGWMDSVR